MMAGPIMGLVLGIGGVPNVSNGLASSGEANGLPLRPPELPGAGASGASKRFWEGAVGAGRGGGGAGRGGGGAGWWRAG